MSSDNLPNWKMGEISHARKHSSDVTITRPDGTIEVWTPQEAARRRREARALRQQAK